MATLSTYLGHVDGSATLGAYVSFDTVSTAVNNENDADTTTLNVTYTNATTWLGLFCRVTSPNAESAEIVRDVKSGAPMMLKSSNVPSIERVVKFDSPESIVRSNQFTVGGQDVLDINGDGAPAAYTFTGQTVGSVLNALNDADNKALATAQGVTMSAHSGGNSSLAIHVGSQLNSALWETSNAIVTNLHLTASDVINVTVGNQTVTLTAPTSNASYEVYAVAKSVGAAIATRWAAVNTGNSEPIFNFNKAVTQASSTINSATGHMLTFTAKDRGTGGEGLTASITLSALDATGNNGTLPLAYGATRSTSDNSSTGPDVVLTFESNTAGASLVNSVLSVPANSTTSGIYGAGTLSHAAVGIAGISELHTNYNASTGTGSATYLDGHHDESNNDVRVPSDDTYLQNETITTAAVALKSRLAWLSS